MRIVLFGATGTTGTWVLHELLAAGHEVTAVVRNPSKINRQHPRLKPVAGDVLDPAFVATVISGNEAVVSTISEGVDIVQHTQSKGNVNIMAAMSQLGLARFICMGAEGILSSPEGPRYRDLPGYPELYKPLSYEHERVWQALDKSALDWLQVCPPMILPEPADQQYEVRPEAPGSSAGRINAGNIGHFIGRELEQPKFSRCRVGIANRV